MGLEQTDMSRRPGHAMERASRTKHVKKPAQSKRETVHTEYFMTEEKPEPSQTAFNKRIPSTSKRKSEKLHYRTGSLHKNPFSKQSAKDRSFRLNLRGGHDHTAKNIKFDFEKIFQKNLKQTRRNNGPKSSRTGPVSAKMIKDNCDESFTIPTMTDISSPGNASSAKFDALFEKKDSRVSDRTNESQISRSQIMALLDNRGLIQEVFFRYSHELNKVIFWLDTARQIFDYLHQNKICKAMLVFACLNLIKAKSRCKLLIQSLVTRENRYKLGRFAEFLESPKHEAIILKFRGALAMARKMEKTLRGIRRFFFFIKYYHLEEIFQGNITDSEYQKIISSQLLGMIKEKIKKSKRNRKSKLT